MKRPPKRDSSGSPEDWLVHAESDLNLARVARERKDVLSEQACFHAQQAAEKSFKAVLLFKHVEFPLVHDLETLVGLLQENAIPFPSGNPRSRFANTLLSEGAVYGQAIATDALCSLLGGEYAEKAEIKC